jgi:chromosome segregation ATPase|tara:strand:- start:841 stop:1548 length:708 start_codon:yes stop_codon:yes gene_type:complete
MSIQDSEIKVNKADSNYLNKKQQSGGLFLGFIFVLMLSSILALALWVNQISSTNNSNITGYEERISLLEEQLNIVDSVNTDSMTGIASQLQFLDKEIRKLWDLSNKRNKVKIQETETRLEELKIRIESLQETSIQLDQLSTLNQANIADQSQKLQSIESSNKSLLELRKDIKSLNTDILLMEESLQALNNYRKQNNAVIVQLQNEIRLLNSSILNLEKSSSAKGDNFITDEATSE